MSQIIIIIIERSPIDQQTKLNAILSCWKKDKHNKIRLKRFLYTKFGYNFS